MNYLQKTLLDLEFISYQSGQKLKTQFKLTTQYVM